MKQAVIGANGFLGSSIVRRLMTENNVVAIYNRNIEKIKNIEYVQVNDFITAKIDDVSVIYYVVGNYSNTYDELVYLNCELLNKVIEVYGEAKIVYISSTNVYGNQNNIISESSYFKNPNSYGLSKIAGEFISRKAKKYAIVRLCYLYGPGLNNGSFIPNIINQALNNEIMIFGEGKREQDYFYIDDAVNLIIKASEYESNDIFLGATGKSFSNIYIANLLKENNPTININFSGTESGISFYFNPEETFRKLKWRPKISIEQGIKNIWNEISNNR